VKKQDFASARHAIHQLMANASVLQQQTGLLLTDLLDQREARTPLELWQARIRHAAHLTEYLWIGLQTLQSLTPHPWYRRWFFRPSKEKSRSEGNPQQILALYWWFQMTLARQAGKLPAWEGIRIVRERPPL